MTDREEWKRLAEAATPGPWIAEPNPMRSDGMFIRRSLSKGERRRYAAPTLVQYAAGLPASYEPLPAICGSQVPPHDAAFIAAARTAVPALLASEAQALARADKAEGESVRLTHYLRVIQGRSATSPMRTLGEASDELARINDFTRAALASTGDQDG